MDPDLVKIKCTICAFLGYYAAYNGNYLPKFRDNLSAPGPIGTRKLEIAQNLMSSLRPQVFTGPLTVKTWRSNRVQFNHYRRFFCCTGYVDLSTP